MKRRVAVWGAIVWGLATGLSACDRGSDGPPVIAAPAAESLAIGLVLPRPGPPELNVWEQGVRVAAAREKIDLEVIIEPADRQADAVREAMNRGVRAAIVLPADPEAIAPALAEVRDQGLPIVLLGRPVEVPGKPLPLVAFPPLERAADQLVDAAREDARAAGFPADGPALIVANSPGPASDAPRVAALQKALEAAKVRVLPVARFTGYVNEATAVIQPALKAHPELAMILTEEDMATQAAATIRYELPRTRPRFVVAGFAADKQTLDMMKFNLCAGLIDRQLPDLARRAFQAALDLARGGSIPDRIEVDTPLVRATGAEKPGFRTPQLKKPEEVPPEDLIPR